MRQNKHKASNKNRWNKNSGRCIEKQSSVRRIPMEQTLGPRATQKKEKTYDKEKFNTNRNTKTKQGHDSRIVKTTDGINTNR